MTRDPSHRSKRGRKPFKTRGLSKVQRGACLDSEGVAVEGDEVGRVGLIASDGGTRGFGELLDEVQDIGGGVELLDAHEVGGEAGNVRASCCH